MHQDGTLYQTYTYEKLKEIAKQIYLSPLDYSDLYLDMRAKIDKAEMIKLDLKKILQEFESSNTIKIGGTNLSGG